jgi:hypothetical protein
MRGRRQRIQAQKACRLTASTLGHCTLATTLAVISSLQLGWLEKANWSSKNSRYWTVDARAIKGVEENQCPTRVPVLWVGRLGRTATCFPCGSGWVSGCEKPLDPSSAGGGQGAVLPLWASRRPEITSSQSRASHAGYRGRAENKLGPRGWLCQSLRAKGRKGQGENGHWVVPTQVRVLGPVRGWSTGRPSSGRLDTAH